MTIKDLKDILEKVLEGFKQKKEEINKEREFALEGENIKKQINDDYHNILLYTEEINKFINMGMLDYLQDDFNSLLFIIKNEDILKMTFQYELARREIGDIALKIGSIQKDNQEIEFIDKMIGELDLLLAKFKGNELVYPILDVDVFSNFIDKIDINKRIEIMKLVIALNNESYKKVLNKNSCVVQKNTDVDLFTEVEIDNLFYEDEKEEKEDDRLVAEISLNEDEEKIFNEMKKVLLSDIFDKMPNLTGYKGPILECISNIEDVNGMIYLSFDDKRNLVKGDIEQLEWYWKAISEEVDRVLKDDEEKLDLEKVKIIYLPYSNTSNVLTEDSFCDLEQVTWLERDMGIDYINEYSLIARFLDELKDPDSRVIYGRSEHQITVNNSNQYWIKKCPPNKSRLCYRKVSNDKEEHSVVMVIGINKQYGDGDGKKYTDLFDKRISRDNDVIQKMIVRFNEDKEYRDKVLRANLVVNERISNLLSGKKKDMISFGKGARG